jgi:hypothetical protein
VDVWDRRRDVRRVEPVVCALERDLEAHLPAAASEQALQLGWVLQCAFLWRRQLIALKRSGWIGAQLHIEVVIAVNPS